MVKKYRLVLCMSVILALLSGCGNTNKDNNAIGELSEPSTDVTVTTVETTVTENKNTSDYKESDEPTESTTSITTVSSAQEEIAFFADINVENYIETTVFNLRKEYDQLKNTIDTYDKYKSNVDKIEEFYAHILAINRGLCLRMYEYSIDYANTVISSDSPYDEKYDDLEDLFDDIYDDAGDMIFDEIYDGILDEMFDDFYDGLLDDAYDTVDYSEWEDARSDEYDMWSDTRSDVYSDWSDYRSDVYGFYSDMRSAMWSKDIEKAEKKIEKFQKRMSRFKESGDVFFYEIENYDYSANKNAEISSETVSQSTVSSEENISGIRPEFKETLDSYEEFFDSYCEFMEKYLSSPADLSLLNDYSDFTEQYEETSEKLDELGKEDMSEEELNYYMEVMMRITTKLLSIY